jgi:tetratricopeptide (TPR) repeat protein
MPENIDLQLQKEILNAYLNLAMLLHRAGEFEEAEHLLQQAQGRDSQAVSPRLALSLLLLDQGRCKEAASTLEEAVSLVPPEDRATLAFLYSNLGIAYQEAGEQDKALQFFQKV